MKKAKESNFSKFRKVLPNIMEQSENQNSLSLQDKNFVDWNSLSLQDENFADWKGSLNEKTIVQKLPNFTTNKIFSEGDIQEAIGLQKKFQDKCMENQSNGFYTSGGLPNKSELEIRQLANTLNTLKLETGLIGCISYSNKQNNKTYILDLNSLVPHFLLGDLCTEEDLY